MRGWSILGQRLAARPKLPMSRHAERRMRERMIPLEEIRATLASAPSHRSHGVAVFKGPRVVVILGPDGNIVTVYWARQEPFSTYTPRAGGAA